MFDELTCVSSINMYESSVVWLIGTSNVGCDSLVVGSIEPNIHMQVQNFKSVNVKSF